MGYASPSYKCNVIYTLTQRWKLKTTFQYKVTEMPEKIAWRNCLNMEKVGPPPRVTLPSKRVPPSQLCDFSCKRFAAIYKEMYEKLSRPGWLGMEGDPPTRDNFSPYKQALQAGYCKDYRWRHLLLLMRQLLERCYGEVLWRGAMERCYGEVLWRGAMERCYGEVLQ